MPIVCARNGVPTLTGGHPGELMPMTSLGGATASTTITQSAETWIDAGAFRHAVFEIDIRYQNRDPHIYLETSDTLDDDGFVTLVDHPATASGKFIYKLGSFRPLPLLRYVRWRVGDGTASFWKVTLTVLALFKSQG